MLRFDFRRELQRTIGTSGWQRAENLGLLARQVQFALPSAEAVGPVLYLEPSLHKATAFPVPALPANPTGLGSANISGTDCFCNSPLVVLFLATDRFDWLVSTTDRDFVSMLDSRLIREPVPDATVTLRGILRDFVTNVRNGNPRAAGTATDSMRKLLPGVPPRGFGEAESFLESLIDTLGVTHVRSPPSREYKLVVAWNWGNDAVKSGESVRVLSDGLAYATKFAPTRSVPAERDRLQRFIDRQPLGEFPPREHISPDMSQEEANQAFLIDSGAIRKKRRDVSQMVAEAKLRADKVLSERTTIRSRSQLPAMALVKEDPIKTFPFGETPWFDWDRLEARSRIEISDFGWLRPPPLLFHDLATGRGEFGGTEDLPAFRRAIYPDLRDRDIYGEGYRVLGFGYSSGAAGGHFTAVFQTPAGLWFSHNDLDPSGTHAITYNDAYRKFVEGASLIMLER